jgi:glycosyltransferase involved in cell wall biosynthesis
MIKTIVLFTHSYPYSIALEDEFIEPELEVLSHYFNIVIIPLSKKGKKSSFIEKFSNITVCENFKEFNKKEIYNFLKINKSFFEEFKYIKKFSHIKKLLIRFMLKEWIKRQLEYLFDKNILKKDYIFYTYWFDYATTALVDLKQKFNIKIITRAHGYDLYEEERQDGYIPFRKRDVYKVNKIITISEKGFNYLKTKYNLENLYNSYMGIRDFNIITPVNNSFELKIISCSFMSEVKRIDFIMKYLSKFSSDENIKIQWHHIGDGILKDKLYKLKNNLEHKNFKINFVGYLENKKVFEYYKNNSFDYFITLSKSEGLPVSLMEACSVGLPIIATDVGGINEIVKDKINGFLLNANLDYNEFKTVMKQAIEIKKNNEKYKNMKQNSRKIYLEKFRANVNYKKFAEFLKNN